MQINEGGRLTFLGEKGFFLGRPIILPKIIRVQGSLFTRKTEISSIQDTLDRCLMSINSYYTNTDQNIWSMGI